ncbi:MAG: LysR family transcriptional regulator [Cypionkella sp.]|nr:LysR family transcriptional regulator [Cypionkella sp.]
MDIRWLQDFLALAEMRNFTRAAEFRAISQAAFSRRIQSLEHWLGTALVVKGTQPVRLTEAGAQFQTEAAAAVERLLSSRATIRAGQFDVMSQIRLAMPNALARSDFRGLLGAIGGGKTSFSVIVGTTSDVTARYLAGDADILIAHHCPALAGSDGPQELALHERLTLRQESFAPYAAIGAQFDFPGSGRASFPLIAYAQRAYFAQVFEAILERNEGAAAYRIAVQCDMTDVLKEVIAAGRGIGWLPQSAVEAGAQIAPIGGPEWAMQLQVCAWRPARAPSPEVAAFWGALAAQRS